MIAKILLFFLWFFVWLGLVGIPSAQYLILGAVVAAFVSFMTVDVLAEKTTPAKNLKSPAACLWLIYYIAVFLWECVKANIDVAYRVLHPALPIRPGTIKVKTCLKSDVGLTFLANSVTLTPGTTTVDIDRDKGLLYIHWIYVPESYDKASMRLKVVERFENILRRIFE